MDPTMIEIGPFRIAWYGFFLTVAIFAGFEIAKRILKRWNLDPSQFEQAAFWAVVWGVIGARIGYVLTSPSEFVHNPVEALYIWRGGLSFHGAMVGGVLAFYYYYRRYGYPMPAYLDASMPGVAIGIMAGRLGNFMNGSDTVGRLTNLPIGFTWPQSAPGFPGICKSTHNLAFGGCLGEIVRGPVHLTQFYGLLIGLVLLFLSFHWIRQNRPFGYVFWQFVLWYSVLRSVFEETFRLNPLWWRVYENDQIGIGFFTATQLISIPLIILAMVMLRRWPKGERQPASVAVPKAKVRPKGRG
ncbi:MAG: prolipoprotein diacylglyceryl transferase [Meiothermus sp.]